MDTNYLNKLSTKIGLEWYNLGVELGFQTSQLYHLQNAYPQAVQQCISIMLTEWYQAVTKEIPKPAPILSEALKAVERTDIAVEIKNDFTSSEEKYDKSKIPKVKQLLMDVNFNKKSNKLEMFHHPTVCCIRNFEKEKSTYVETEASKRSIEELKSKKYITVVGNAGDGKTTLVMNLLSKVSKEGYYPIILSDPALIEQAYDQEKQIVYFVDDAFGTPTLNYNLVQIWIRLHQKLKSVISNGNCYLVLASRKQVYSKARPHIVNCPCYLDNVIDLTIPQYELSSTEKKNIIACHVRASTSLNGKRRQSFNSMAPMLYVPGFPLLCSLYAKHDTGNMSAFFEKPVSFLQRQIGSLRTSDPEAYCALVVVMLYNGRLRKDILDPFEMEEKDKQKIKKIVKACGMDKTKFFTEVEASLQSLVGIYLENDGDDFVYTHDSVFDAMCLDFGMKYPKQVLEVASSDFITSRVRTEDEINTLNNPSGVPETVYISANHYSTLVQRWMTDIKTGKLSNVFDNPCSKNVKIVKFILDYMSKLEVEKREEEFESLFSVKDIASSASLLEMICKRGVLTLVKPIFEHGYRRFIKTDDKVLSFIEGVRNGHESIVKVFAEYEPDIHRSCLKNGRRAIHVASEKGNPRMVKILIDIGASVSARDIFNIQPIHLASKNIKSDCLLILIENGTSCNAEDNSKLLPTHYACKSGSIQCLKTLVEKGADINRQDTYGKTPLHYAAACENTNVLEYLLNNNPNINALDANGNSVLHLAIASENPSESIKRLIEAGCNPNFKDRYGRSPLHIACSSSWKKSENCEKCIQTLIQYGADVNMCDKKHRTPLYTACLWSCDYRYSCVKILIDHGADVNIEDLNEKRPVTCAFESKSSKCAKLLLDKGSDFNTAGLNPVHSACSHGNYEILLTLHEKGIPLSSEDANGKYPIHFASQYGRLKCLIFLLENGEDINVKDRRGMTPLHHAFKWGRENCITYLIKHGADTKIKNADKLKPTDLSPPWSPLKFSRSMNRDGLGLRKNSM